MDTKDTASRSDDTSQKSVQLPKTQPTKGATQSAAEFYHRVNIEECLYTDNFEVTDACISCGACAAECPVSAITEGDAQYVIDDATCIECGACAGVCPVGAPAQA